MAGRVLFNLGRHPSRGGRRAKEGFTPLDELALRRELDQRLGPITPADFMIVVRELLVARSFMPDAVIAPEYRPSFQTNPVELMHEVAKRLGCATQSDFNTVVRALLTSRPFTPNNMAAPEDKEGIPCGDLAGPMTRRDTVAQLKALLRLDDESIIDALTKCDASTFSRIQEADMALIARVIRMRKSFVDSLGDEYLFPPQMEISPNFVYLPTNISGLRVSGLRRAIKRALRTVDGNVDKAGKKEKGYQTDLAKLCRYLWAKYRPERSQKAWCMPNTGDDADGELRRSELVLFAELMFCRAGMDISSDRLADILNERKKLSN